MKRLKGKGAKELKWRLRRIKKEMNKKVPDPRVIELIGKALTFKALSYADQIEALKEL